MPEPWPQATLGDVATWFSGATPKAGKSEYYEGGTIPWATIGDMQDRPIVDTATRLTEAGASIVGRLAPVGAVLVSMYGTIGRTALAAVPMATNQAIAWGVPHDAKYSSEFLFLVVQALRQRLDSLGRGATQRNINRAILREQPVPIPPLSEQRRIVDLISALDALVSALQQEKAAAHAMSLAAAGDAVSQAMKCEVMMRLDALLAVPATYGVLKPGPEVVNGVPLIRGQNIQRGTVSVADVRTISDALDAEYRRSRVATGDLVLVLVGTPGACGLVPAALDGANISRAVGRLRCGPALDPQYLLTVLSSPWGRTLLGAEVRGAVQQMINLKELRALTVPVPPLDLQVALGRDVATTLRLVDELEAEIEALARSREALLTGLVSGAITLPASYDRLLEEAA